MKTYQLQAGAIQLTGHFDLVDFRLLINVAETLSLSRGAELSNMSAPAASTRIKKIEESLGIKLFVRNSHGLSPTLAGSGVLKHAKKILSQFELLLNELNTTSTIMKGDIRLHANTLSLLGSMPNALQKYLMKYPEVNIILQEHSSTNITRALVSGEADIGVLASENRSDKLEYIPYRREKLVLITPLHHALSETSQIHFRQSLSADFIGLSQHSALQQFIIRVAGDVGASIKLRIQVNHFESICKLVESGIGIALIPETIATAQARFRRIAMVSLIDRWAERELTITHRKDDFLSLPCQRLIETLLNHQK